MGAFYMSLNEIITMDKKYYMNVFGNRTQVCFESGKGYKLYDTNGKEYIDFFAGIAVNSLGYCHDAFTKKVSEQLNKVIHTSSIYYIESQAKLAKELCTNSCADRVMFCNSGTEANEGAIKLAKMYAKKKGYENKYEFITLINSFHGRTLAAVAATGQEKFQNACKPLMPEFKHIPINDITALENAVSEKTCAVMLELIQGESGVNPINKEFLEKAKVLCEKYDCLLIFDEVQTGIGRTGKLFAYENYGVEPDVFTLAKALGNGIPIGAICAKEKAAEGFSLGDHGTTFGGNPFSCTAGLAVLEAIKEENLLTNVNDMSLYLKAKLNELKEKNNVIKEIRGLGLMIGIELKEDIGKDINKKLLEKGFIVGSIGTKVLRLVPPLIIDKDAIDKLYKAMNDIFAN
jgi:acetylornithine aminotransferase/acetylornithine/N-succinyldiaminopimelate aminotransferase